jgi:predicted dehydrogenase
VTAERGRVVIEHDRFLYTRNEVPMSKFCNESPERFSQPSTWNVEIPLCGHGGQHDEVLQNFVDAILQGESLIAPAEEGVHSVELANAMLLSSFTDKTVEIPIGAKAYELFLKEKITSSTIRKKVASLPVSPIDDFTKSFRR